MPLLEKTPQYCSPVLVGVCGVATVAKTPQSWVEPFSQVQLVSESFSCSVKKMNVSSEECWVLVLESFMGITFVVSHSPGEKCTEFCCVHAFGLCKITWVKS